MTKRITVLLLAAAWLPAAVSAAGGGGLQSAPVDLTNKASLQRGAKYFVNYCMGCHSAKYVRYKRVAKDLGIPESIAEDKLKFTEGKLSERMTNAMRPADGEQWFGAAPPDLSLVTRHRGPDWVYTFLKSFYLDESTVTGANNRVLENASMPHVLWRLQGWRKPVYETVTENGEEHERFSGYEQVTEGTLTPEEYDQVVTDLVNYLTYMGEPVRLKRQRIGFWVLGFLAVLFVLAYLLKREYWKDVH